MIHFVIGRPGGGKSMQAVRIIVDELRLTKRNVVTNVALKLPELAEYLHREYGDTFGMCERIRMLTPQEVIDFWNHPAMALDCTGRVTIAEANGKKIDRPDMSLREFHPGTLFVIDEVHEYFGARQWQTTGPDALFYLSQHRKFGDDVVLITQAFANVDKQFRSVAQDYTVLRNMSLEKIGFFRLPAKIIRQTFFDPPTGSARAAETAMVKIDTTGLGQCYDTAAGVGVMGRQADTQRLKPRGLPWWMAFVPILAVGAILYYLPDILGMGVAHVTNIKLPEASASSRPVAAAREVQKAAQTLVPNDYAEQQRQADLEPLLEVMGYGSDGAGGYAWLSDGRSVRLRFPRVSKVNEDGSIVLDGRLVPLHRKSHRLPWETSQPTASPQPATGSVVANPEARATQRVRVMGFDGNLHRVATAQPRSFSGDE